MSPAGPIRVSSGVTLIAELFQHRFYACRSRFDSGRYRPFSAHGRVLGPYGIGSWAAPIRIAHIAPAGGPCLKKTQVKKTRKQRKKTCSSLCFEEDPGEENPLFKPAESLHYQNGGDKAIMGLVPDSRCARPMYLPYPL